MTFIILIVARAATENGIQPFKADGVIMNSLVSYGLFLVILIQIIGILFGDKTPVTVSHDSRDPGSRPAIGFRCCEKEQEKETVIFDINIFVVWLADLTQEN